MMGSKAQKYHFNLSKFFVTQSNFFDGELQKKPHVRKCMEQPWQQTKAELWDEVTDTLCNLDFIQAKAAAKLTYALVKDYHLALDGLPEYQIEKEKDRNRQERMDKYTRDLIACAKGDIEIGELEIPESIIPWTQEKIHAEIKRIKNNPQRVNKLKDFINFLGHEADNLQKYASEFSYFSVQQAWNWTDDGSVGIAANKESYKGAGCLLLKLNQTRPSWDPMPLVRKKVSYQENHLRKCNITPDAKYAVVKDDTNFATVDLISGEIISIVKTDLKSNATLSACVSLDCKYAALGFNEEIIYWSLQDKKEIKRISIPDDRKDFIDNDDLKKNERRSISHNFTNSLGISADRQILISGHKDNSVRIWNIGNGEQTRVLSNSLGDAIVNVRCDGRWAISASNNSLDSKIIIWDLAKDVIIANLKCYQAISALSFTPDLKYIIYGTYKGLLSIFESVSKTVTEIDIGETGIIRPLEITADGRFAIFCNNKRSNELCIWDLLNKKLNKTLRTRTSITDAKITPDGRIVVLLDGENNVIVWDLEKGFENENKKSKHDGVVEKVSINTDGTYALSSSFDETLIIWNFRTGDVLKIFGGHTSTIISFDISNDNRRIVTSGAWDFTIIIRDLNDQSCIKIENAHNHIINIVYITPDNNRVVSCSDDQTVAIWDIESGHIINRIKDFNSWVRKFELTPDGKYAVAADKKILVHNLDSGKIVSIYNYEIESIACFKILPDGKAALIIHRNGKIAIWSILTGKIIAIHHIIHESRIPVINISWSGKTALLSFLDFSVRRINIKTGKLDQVFIGHNNYVIDIQTFSNDKYFVSCGLDKKLILWDIEEAKKLAVYPNRSKYKSLNINTKGIITGDQGGDVIMLDLRNKYGLINEGIVTLKSIWNFESQQYQSLSADCPFCGHGFAPPALVLATIEKITKKARLRPEQSPCVELPDEAREEPGLLSDCPKCGETLKFNPFIAGGDL